MSELQFTLIRAGTNIAYRHEQADSRRTGIFWLSGLKSDMTGTKAEALADFARETHRPILRFDFSGHGASGGVFQDQTLSDWLDEAVHMFKNFAKGRQVIVGSSMGGYLALLLYRKLHQETSEDLARINGFVLIAPAADMTEALLWAKLNDQARQSVLTNGQTTLPSQYGEPYAITRALIEDGRKHLILADGIDVHSPTYILQGDEDPDVPWQHAHKLYKAIRGKEILFTLIKGGDHRLSTARDIAELRRVTESLCVKGE